MHAPEAAALKRELATVFGELEAVLSAEFAALRSRDVAALEQSSATKFALVSRLERLAPQLARLDRAAIARELAAVRAQAQACLSANRVNGGTIELNRSFTERLLDVLRGERRTAPLYDAGGRLERRTGLRRVGYA